MDIITPHDGDLHLVISPFYVNFFEVTLISGDSTGMLIKIIGLRLNIYGDVEVWGETSEWLCGGHPNNRLTMANYYEFFCMIDGNYDNELIYLKSNGRNIPCENEDSDKCRLRVPKPEEISGSFEAPEYITDREVYCVEIIYPEA